MKIFDTINSLYDYCLTCPICKEKNRKITGESASQALQIISVNRSGKFIKVNGKLQLDGREYLLNYNIDGDNNTYTVKFSETKEGLKFTANSFNQYFHIIGECENCNCSDTKSSMIQLELGTDKIYNLSVAKDSVLIVDTADRESPHLVTLDYERNMVDISICIANSKMWYDKNGDLNKKEKIEISDPVSFTLPDIDFTDSDRTEKALKKINKMIFLSL